MSSKKIIDYSLWAVEIDDGVEVWTEPSDKHFTIECNSCLTTTRRMVLTIYQTNGGITRLVIPEGWEFDGASIPKMFWSIIGKPTARKFRLASMVHDWLYGIRFERKTSDELFRKILKAEGVWNLKANVMWAAVRVGGHVIYHSDDSTFYKRAMKLMSKL